MSSLAMLVGPLLLLGSAAVVALLLAGVFKLLGRWPLSWR
jgi:hypothetical protein